MKFPKVKQIKVDNQYKLRDTANKRDITGLQKQKFSKSQISVCQFTLELKRIDP